MFITVTNASPQFKGHPTMINMDICVSIYRGEALREDGTKDAVTFIHCPPHGTWECEETLDEIEQQLKS